ncbi:NADH-quinone oxidoreductase subunit NuoE [Pontibacter sp. MBLB2868]|uniref:NADH-quinone oxidoreductase subunit NuoE n=1 Tax=Pontibacter sp. MBLB2868 TaxID=3451555 RepID=UPI003F757105
MLTTEEIQKIEHEISLVPLRKAACVEALKVVQKHRGWVSDDVLKAVAEYMDMSAAELDSVATFYNLIFRQPVGRHVILVCDSISCWVMGYENIKEGLTLKLGIQYGQTTPDGRFTILPNVCLGCCDHAPALMIDDDLYQDITLDKLDELLEKYA